MSYLNVGKISSFLCFVWISLDRLIMMYVPVTIFRLFASFYILTVPVLQSDASVTQQFVDHPKKTSNAMTFAHNSAQTRYHASCELQPNFRCASGDYCIPVKLVLNGYKDCPDASDEDARKVDFCRLGPAFHRCDVNSRCLTTAFGYRCQCKDGYAGDGFYCERFPMGIQITISTNDTLEDSSVHFNVSIVVFPYGQNSNLSLTVIGLPPDAKFDIGLPCNTTSWCFGEEDFTFGTYVNAEFFPPRDFSGVIPLTIIAEIYRDGFWVTGFSLTSMQVVAVPDAPILRIGTACFPNEDTPALSIPVRARLADTDGSEELEIDFDGLPDGFDISTSTDQTGEEVAKPIGDAAVTTLVVKPFDKMVPFNVTISAVAKEKSNGKENVTSKTIMVAQCPPQPNMNVVFDVPEEVVEGQPIPVHVTVKFDLEENPRLISVQLINFPHGASVSRGHRAGNLSVWVLSRQDLADDGLFLTPPPYFSGEFVINAQSEALYRGFLYNLNSTAVIEITPVATVPVLRVYPEVICLSINATKISFVIDAALLDTDGSESIVVQYNIPENWIGSVGDSFHGSYSLMSDNVHELLNVTVSSAASEFLYPVEIPVVVMAIEKESAEQQIIYTTVKITVCDGSMSGFLPQVRQRTTIIWNVTTPQPQLTEDTGDMSSNQNITLKTRQGAKKLSHVTPSIPINTTTRNTTAAQLLLHPNHSKVDLADYDKSTGVPEAAASSLDIVHEILDSAQDDESPRFNRNFSFLEITPPTSTARNSITRTPLKVQRLARPDNNATTTIRPRSRPHKKGKPKVAQMPGKAEMDNVKIEQFATIANGTEDNPIQLNITVITKNAPIQSAIQTRVIGLPQGSYLTRGILENSSNTWRLEYHELGALKLYLPLHASGKIPLTIASTLNLVKNKTLTARENFDLRVRPETDGGQLEITSPYFQTKCVKDDEKDLRFTVKVRLEDNDGSEEVEYLELRGLPKGVRVEPGRILGNDLGYLIFARELPTFDIRSEKNFPSFELILDAKVREKVTGIKNSVTKQISIVPCSGASSLGENYARLGCLERHWFFSFPLISSLFSTVIMQRFLS